MNSLITLAQMALVSLLAFSFALCVGMVSLAAIFHLAFDRLQSAAR